MKYMMTVLLAWVIVVTVALTYTEVRVTNLEKQLLRIERDYETVIAYNQKMEHMNDANLKLLAEGGWK